MNTTKIPATKHAVHSMITKRWSARSFAERHISDDNMKTMLEAASWAPSSMNEQPWKYLIAKRGSEAFDQMVACLMPGNAPWAKDGSHMLISLAKKHFDRNGNFNRHYMHDVGAANTSLLLQAADLDIYGHMMGGFVMETALDVFNIDENIWEIACFIVLGHLDDPDKLEEPYKTRELTERKRKPINEFVEEL